ncbi:MAG: helix-turn-helix domain-containing protein [Kiritimatiellae bacterium]|nr:helix-turn-helix domain-containing protein [Kiritimatiellia bacterium]
MGEKKEKGDEVSYNNLWKLLIDLRMTKTQMRLAAGISTVTLARMNKGFAIRESTVERICKALDCKPKDIMSVSRAAKKKGAAKR